MLKDNELNLYTSIIDYVGKIDNGVAILISITIYEFTFQGMYWFDKDNNKILEIENNFLKLFSCLKTDDLPFLNELIEDIESILPDKQEIFEAYC